MTAGPVDFAAIVAAADGETSTDWEPQDLTDVLDPAFVGLRPELGLRDDGAALLYPGSLHLLFGDSESGKTWLALCWAGQELRAGRPVLYIDVETSRRQLVPRLLALGVERETIARLFWYVNPTRPMLPGTAERLASRLCGEGGRLVVLDATTELLSLHGLKSNHAEDVAALWGMLGRPFAAAGAAPVAIDHQPKDAAGKGDALGSQHKVSGVDVALWCATVSPFGRGLTGRTMLRRRKDRDGWLSHLEVGAKRDLAAVSLESFADDGVTIHVTAPADTDEPTTARDHRLYAAVCEYVASNPGVSGRKVEEDVTGSGPRIRSALVVLEEEGFVRTEDGPRRARLHHPVNEYREGQK